MQSVDDKAHGDIPNGVPLPKGNLVRATTFVDANIVQCKVTGYAATGMLHLLNQTPVDWFSNKQATVETATHGSEFVTARHATEQIIAEKLTLQYMGIPLEEAASRLGDNQCIIKTSTIPHSDLNKRHNALTCRCSCCS